MTETNLSKHDELELQAAEYVIGTLEGNERKVFELLMDQDDRAAQAVDYWQTRLAPLDELAPPRSASPFLEYRINRSIDQFEKVEPAQRKWWNSTKLWRLSTAALLVLSLGLAMQQEAVPTHIVVLTAPGDTQPGWMLKSYNGASLELTPLSVVTVPADKVLQFWTKAEGWDRPVSLGLVDPDRSLQTQLAGLPVITKNQLFELTIEQPGGSPTGLPTGPIQFIGRAVTGI